MGDLAFGAPFGMLEAAKDIAVVPKNQEDVMRSYGTGKVPEVIEIPAVKILNGRGEYSMSMGVLPAWWRPFVRQLPWYRKGQADVKALAGIAIMAVAKRLATPTDRVDLLSKLQAGRDGEGKPMGSEELTAEALTLLIAGSDTTSKYDYHLTEAHISDCFGFITAPPALSYITSHSTTMSKKSYTRNWTNNWDQKMKLLPPVIKSKVSLISMPASTKVSACTPHRLLASHGSSLRED